MAVSLTKTTDRPATAGRDYVSGDTVSPWDIPTLTGEVTGAFRSEPDGDQLVYVQWGCDIGSALTSARSLRLMKAYDGQ